MTRGKQRSRNENPALQQTDVIGQSPSIKWPHFLLLDFLVVDLLTADFLAGAFLALVWEEDFLLAVFLAEAFFALGDGGMFAPERRASLRPMAMACFGFFTALPLRPDVNS